MTVSGPTVTSESMTQVSGRKMVTPCGHQAASGVSAHGWSRCIISAMVLAPRTSSTLSGLESDDAAAVGDEHGGDVGEVELAVGVVGGEQIELGEERFGFEAVDAGVDLGGVELVGLEGLLLDDADDFGLVGRAAQDAAVAGGVGGDGGEDGHRGVLRAGGVRRGDESVSGRMRGTSPERTRRCFGSAAPG